MLEVWTSWFPFCAAQNVNLQKLQGQLKAQNKALPILAVSVDRERAAAVAYMKAKNYSFSYAMQTPKLADALGKRRGIAMLYVLDGAGKVLQKEYGEMVDLDVFDLARYAVPN
ncbi:MAG: TlpA family protein disulfide reductase [Candidatus Protistobacter heckmanni]|nr:TlpA family protein disulfide reductase [Candidatus Protistobacter heckmanni]